MRQQLGVHRQKLLKQSQFVAAIFAFAQIQIRQRAYEGGFDLMPQSLCLGNLRQKAAAVEAERCIGGEFRHDVMVIGVKPFGHFTCVDFAIAMVFGMGCGSRTTTGDAKVIVQIIAMKVLGSLRQITQQETGVQHLVVKRKIAHRHKVQIGLQRPMALAQTMANALQGIQIAVALPIGF